MNLKLSKIKRFLTVFALLLTLAVMAGCGGSDGKDGATGPAGPQGPAGPEGPAGPPGQDLTAVAEPESCSVCHSNVGQSTHQAVYDDYVDSTLAMQITEVKSVAAGGAYDVTMTFKLTKDGMPYVDADGLPGLQQKRFYVQGYDSATRSFPNALNKALSNPVAVAGQPGTYKVSATGVSYAPEKSNAEAYGYVAQGVLATEGMTLYGDVDNAGKSFGNVSSYDSYANVEGCELCHGTPYRKHGYRAAAVNGLPDFAACKVCHMDDRAGGHQLWQQIVDDPVAWGNGDNPA